MRGEEGRAGPSRGARRAGGTRDGSGEGAECGEEPPDSGRAGGGAPGWDGRSRGRGRRTVRVGRVRQGRHRRIRPTAPACSALSRSPSSEQRPAQPAQRCEQRYPADPCPPVTASVPDVTRRYLPHQRGRLRGLALRERGAAEHREVAVEARTARAAPAGDRRDPRPAAHRYLFHVTPHPYLSTRPGQGNPIAPPGHSCITVTRFTFPARVLMITLRIRPNPGRVGQAAHSSDEPIPRRVPRSRRVTWPTWPGRRPPRACRPRTGRGSAVVRRGA